MNPTNVQSIAVIDINGNFSKRPTVVVTSFMLTKADEINTGYGCNYHVHGNSAAQNIKCIVDWLNGESHLVVNTDSTNRINNDTLVVGPPSVLGKNAGLTAFVSGIIHTEYKSTT